MRSIPDPKFSKNFGNSLQKLIKNMQVVRKWFPTPLSEGLCSEIDGAREYKIQKKTLSLRRRQGEVIASSEETLKTARKMEYTKLIVEKQENICIVRINQPATLNALNSRVLAELDAAFTELAADETVAAVILTGEGKAFVAGADISEMSMMNAIEGKAFGELGARIFRKIELLGKVVIAAVNGFALGGGCELAMACDLRIASAKAKFGQPEVGLGITPGFSGTQRLPRLVGLAKAKELIYTADMIGADEALRIGLVNQVVEPEALMDAALEMARKIASKAPVAVRLAKEAINRGIETDLETGIAIEAQLFGLCFATEDQKVRMKNFLEKKK